MVDMKSRVSNMFYALFKILEFLESDSVYIMKGGVFSTDIHQPVSIKN